ncbi:aldo/keto reductase [Vallitalea okinawensis]|uniref:aldo/keto reductase n=1 Tax=Vallitalea okinawensis TaxID=2078660 RepID=UPI001A9A5445|nr:aldo/keto reductase [Vallitalea okinawensis]
MSKISKTNRLIYGAMGLGGGWNRNPIEEKHIKDAEEAIEAALLIGIYRFDHANIYQLGKSEEVFGHYLKRHQNKREELYIQSKVGIQLATEQRKGQYNFSYEHIMDEVTGSLNRLQTTYLDCLILHRPDPLMDGKELKKAIDNLFSSEMVRQIGVSNMSYHQMKLIEMYIERPLVANQLEMSLSKLDWIDATVTFNHSDYPMTDFPIGTIEYAMGNNIEIQAWGALAQGIYTGRILEEGTPEPVFKTKELVNQIASDKGITPEAIVLAWLMRHPGNISPIIGSKNPDRIRACKDAINVQLSRDEWYELFITSRGKNLP